MDKVARVAASVMLFLAVLAWPYAYYQVLRWVVCGICAWLAYVAAESDRSTWAWVMGISAVLFNPIAPIYLSRGMWTVIDITVGTVLLFSLRYIKTIP